jgi:hypothetical protein
MSRYDWPKGPRPTDDQAGRLTHLVGLRPAADPDAALVPPPAPRRTGRRGAVAKNAPQIHQPFPWIPVGPSVTVDGQGTGRPNVAGRIRDLQVDPTGTRAYAASASGGVWYTENTGASWRPLDDWQESPDRTAVSVVANALACGSIWVKWNGDPSLDDVWVGTGELFGGADFSPSGQIGGVGFLHATGPATGGPWSVVKGGPAADDSHTLRGQEILRIVEDPLDHDALIACTTRGIYVHTGASGPDWTRIPADTPDNRVPVDAVVTRNAGKIRLWVACHGSLAVTEISPPLTADKLTTFTPVTLPEVALGAGPPQGVDRQGLTRLQLAASTDGATVFALGRRYRRAGEVVANLPAHLWTVNAAQDLAHPAATGVNGLPANLFLSGASDQSDYDMAIAAHPLIAGRVYVAGGAIQSGPSNEWNGAVYSCQISGATVVATHIGDRVHADDHVIRVVPPGTAPGTRSVWVGCDGGVFRSDHEGDRGTFLPVNDGLAVLQPGYVASHPTNPGLIAAGFQDNGTALRVGDTVWRETYQGDGGGLFFHPSDGGRYICQYTGATWLGDGSFRGPVQRWGGQWSGGAARTSEDVEGDAASFYSGADAVEHGGETHLAVGTNRVWYSRDWGATWVTLPTGTDPRPRPDPAHPGTVPPDNTNLAQDVLDTARAPDPDTGSSDKRPVPSEYLGANRFGVIAVKFARPKNTGTGAAITSHLRLLVLNRKELVWYTASRATAAVGAFTWDRPTAAHPVARQVFRNTSTDFAESGPTFLPALDIVSDVAVHDPSRGELGSCYVSTIGRPGFQDSSTRDAHIDTLWFFDGHANWYRTGLRVALPAGDWGTGTRVTAPALGVIVDPEHPEIVYVGTSVGVVKGTLTIAGTPTSPTYSWAWEQFMNGLPEAAVQDLSIHWFPRPPVPDVDPPAGPAYDATVYAGSEPPVKLLRAALQARGVWEVDLTRPLQTERTYLRAYASDSRRRLGSAPTAKSVRGDPGTVAAIAWDASPDIAIDTSGTAYANGPTEAQLLKLAPLPAGTAPARYAVANRHPVVHVLIHYRWPVPADKNVVRAMLLRHDLPPDGIVPLGGLWPALIVASHLVSPPTTALPDGWTSAGAELWRKPSANLDPRTPQAVSFTLDWTAEQPGHPFVLLAVATTDGPDTIGTADLTLTGGATATTVAQLVTSSPHCAAVTVGVT